MAIAFGALLAFFVVAVIAYPFLGSRRYRLASQRFVNREKLRVERLQVYRKISDLEVDHASGDLTESDFQSQRDQLRVTAAELLREESGPDGPAMDSDEQLEQEISRMRKRSSRSSETGNESK
jgi:biopolymer transport protein ExbB/TolQ